MLPVFALLKLALISAYSQGPAWSGGGVSTPPVVGSPLVPVVASVVGSPLVVPAEVASLVVAPPLVVPVSPPLPTLALAPLVVDSLLVDEPVPDEVPDEVPEVVLPWLVEVSSPLHPTSARQSTSGRPRSMDEREPSMPAR